ncbi:ankyrin repeat domain-containing protein [Cobetia sp. QF-1]|uniref:ankyrin repeat domain-containing protein n=1 Tax=Cobetia sp. QF-1 TaxID=1969833 RepID=UPI000B542771|nr:ankyrin repeat domain-containing protein [Cobetia sp. QF-1]
MSILAGLTTCLLLAVSAAPAAAASDIDIFDAAREGDNAAIEQYHADGGDISITNSRGYTPFILAAYYGHTESLAVLQEEGADSCALDEKGSNAFMGVAFRGHDQTAEWLLGNTDCDVNHRNYSGQTALMMASLFGREAIIKQLLVAGADPRVADVQGNTAESLAAAQGLSRVVTLVKFNL